MGVQRTQNWGPLPHESDTALMAYLAEGNHDALAEIFVRYNRLVFSIALNYLHDSGEAEDLTQEIFFEIFQKAKSYDSCKGNAKWWIMIYAYSRSLNRRRYLISRRFYDGDSTVSADRFESRCFPRPDRELYLKEIAQIIERGIESLRPQQQSVVRLACCEDLSFVEIASRVGESVGNTRNLYYRGLKALHTYWEQHVFQNQI